MSGLINHDSYSTPGGQDLTNTYVHNEGTVRIQKTAEKYIITTMNHVYVDQACYNNGAQPLARLPMHMEQPLSPEMGNVYDVILDQLQLDFPNHTVA